MTDERGGRHFREARFFFAGDKVVAQSHVLEARSLMGYMRDQHSLGGPAIQVQYATLKDGTQIKATMMNGQYQAQIFSPSGKSVDVRRARRLYVRPLWSSDDWEVAVSDDCTAKTTLVAPKLYSNHVWLSPAGSVYCVIGPADHSKYFGSSGTIIAKDGVEVLGGGGFAGVAEFDSSMITVRRYQIAGAASYNIAGSVVSSQVARFDVEVNGVVVHSTPWIEAYASGGYRRTASLIGFSQTTVLFNSTGSEGICVLGDTAAIKFTVSKNESDAIVAAHEIVTIAGTTSSPSVTVNRVSHQTLTCAGSFPGTMTKTNTTSANDTFDPASIYSQALAAEYAVDDALVYCMLEVTPYGHTPWEVKTATGYSIRTDTRPTCPASATVSFDYFSSSTVYGGPDAYRIYLTSGETLLELRRNSVTYSSTTVAGTTITTVLGDELGVIDVLDIRNKFAAYRSRTRDGTDSTETIVNTWVEARAGGAHTWSSPSGTRVLRDITYTEPTPTTYHAAFLGHDSEVFTVGTQTMQDIALLYFPPQEYTAGCWAGGVPGCAAGDNAVYDNNSPISKAYLPYEIIRYDVFGHLVPVDTGKAFGLTFPDDQDSWGQALVFFQVPGEKPRTFLICPDGATDVSAVFVDGANPPTGGRVSQHFGVGFY